MKNMLNEHLWSGIIHRSETGEERNEDLFCSTKEDIQKKIQEIIDRTHPNVGDTIDLNHLMVSNVKYMSYLFYDLELNIDFTRYNFNVSNWDVSNVENMCSMFDDCEKFNCDLSNWDVSRVTNMNGMFFMCKCFNYDLSKWNVSNVTNMAYMFYNCENFSCDLSRWDVSRVIDMHGMFDGCKKFNCDLSRWNVSKVVNMAYMFDECSSLEKHKNIPDWYKI